MTGFFAVCLFAAGCLVGAIAHKLFTSNAGTASKLTKDLDNVSQDYAGYQDKVDAHFKETSELVQNLTQNYVALHQKLSEGAQGLSRSSITPLENITSVQTPAIEDQTQTTTSAPIDYPERQTEQ